MTLLVKATTHVASEATDANPLGLVDTNILVHHYGDGFALSPYRPGALTFSTEEGERLARYLLDFPLEGGTVTLFAEADA